MDFTEWDSQTFASPGFSEAGTKDVAVSAIHQPQPGDNAFHLTIDYETMNPDTENQAAGYRLSCIVESRADSNSNWRTVAYQRQPINTASGSRMEIVVQSQMLTFDSDETIQVGNQQIGAVSRHQGSLQDEVRFRIICSADDSDANLPASKFVDVTLSAYGDFYAA